MGKLLDGTLSALDGDYNSIGIRITNGVVIVPNPATPHLAHPQTVILLLWTRDDEATNPTVTWGDDGYGDQTLTPWYQDAINIPDTNTGALRGALARAFKSLDVWTQTSWVIERAE